MSGLRPPPSQEPHSRAIGRVIFLVVLLAVLAVIIWAAVVNQRIPLVENMTLDELELESTVSVDGVTFNVDEVGSGSRTMVLLHDADITGSPMLVALASELGDDVRVLTVDLPGFGLTTRLPGEGPGHTVASMATRVASVIESTAEDAVTLVGVGLGGEVAAEIAVTRADLVDGLVMIDVDFYEDQSWVQLLEGVPWLGPAVTYAFESGGSFSASTWAPYCDEGGWCPTEAALEARTQATSIVDTTSSLNGFTNTAPASDVPSRLGDVSAPSLYIWSEKGPVSDDSVDAVVIALPGVFIEVFDTFQAHLDEPAAVAALIRGLAIQP